MLRLATSSETNSWCRSTGVPKLPFRVKSGVDSQRVHPLIWVYAHQIGIWHQDVTGYRMVITSMSRHRGSSYHNPSYAGSQHSMVAPRHSSVATRIDLSTAFDMRRWYFNNFPMLERFCLEVKEELDIGCLIEPEWMTPEQIEARGGIDKIVPHVHWQLSTRNSLWLDPNGQLIM